MKFGELYSPEPRQLTLEAPMHNLQDVEAASISNMTANVQTQDFAGRLGANQQFTLATTDSSAAPDAVRNASWNSILSLSEFKSVRIWKLAFIEGVAVCFQTFLSAALGVGLVPTASKTNLGPVTPVTYAAIFQIFNIAIFVYATGPITGGHLNPLITMATLLARLATLPRACLYVFFQCAGAIAGAFIFRASIGASPEDLVVVPGCYIDSAIVKPGQAFAFEFMCAALTLFLAFGLGLDPRNGTTFGPALAPLLIGLSSAITIFPGGIVRAGYLGSSTNPARCLGLMAAANRFTYHYIHWTADITAILLNGLMYFVVPPYI